MNIAPMMTFRPGSASLVIVLFTALAGCSPFGEGQNPLLGKYYVIGGEGDEAFLSARLAEEQDGSYWTEPADRDVISLDLGSGSTQIPATISTASPYNILINTDWIVRINGATR